MGWDMIHQIKLSDVYYFESVDNKVFMYCRDKVFESKQKLYELEQVVEGKKFFRASKSSIVVQEAKRLGYDSLYLNTNYIGFYERQGWEFVESALLLEGGYKRIYRKNLI